MPIQDIGQGIVESFAKGRALAEEKARRIQQQQQFTEEQKVRQQLADQAHQQFQEQLAQGEEHFKAQQGLEEAKFRIAKNKIAGVAQELFGTKGQVAPGFEET